MYIHLIGFEKEMSQSHLSKKAQQATAKPIQIFEGSMDYYLLLLQQIAIDIHTLPNIS